jgi:hypothetical protein
LALIFRFSIRDSTQNPLIGATFSVTFSRVARSPSPRRQSWVKPSVPLPIDPDNA